MEIEFEKVFKKDSINLSPNIKNAVLALLSEVQKSDSLKSTAGIKT